MSPIVPRLGLLALIALPAQAQGPPPGPVRFTEVRSEEVRGSVDLSGTVESRTESVVASEVAGLVVELSVRPGDRVLRDQPLVKIRSRPYEIRLRAVQGQLREAEARLDLAQRKLERARDLFDGEVISQDQLDDAFSESTAWQGRVDQSQAQVEQLEFDLERCVIRAPFDGAVVSKRTDVGQWIDAGGAAVEMIALEQLQVRIDVPERYYDLLDRAAEVPVRFESLPDLEVTGRLDRIIARADPRARTFPVKIRIDDTAGRVGVGMLAKASLAVGVSRRTQVVPKDAVVRRGPQEFVYRITGDETIETVPVRSGQGLGEWIVVDGDVKAGDRVVTRGNERLQPGQPVSGKPLEYPLP